MDIDDLDARFREHARELKRISAMPEGQEQALAFLTFRREFSKIHKLRKSAARAALEEEMAGVADQPGDWIVPISLGASFAYVPVVAVRQHAVGHGGFHTGALGNERPALRWVYDCGSWRRAGKKSLKDSIKEFTKKLKTSPSARTDGNGGPVVDLLFISHFDADHVSGLDQLLSLVRAETVVIPYLSTTDCFAVLAEAAARGQWSEHLPTALLEPTTWFGERGVRHLVRIRPGDGAPGEGPLAPDFDRPEPSQPFVPVIINSDGGLALRIGGAARATGGTTSVDLDTGASILIEASHREWADWAFIPYVHSASQDATDRARKAAHKLVGVCPTDPSFTAKLKPYLIAPKLRGRLKTIYHEHGLGDANAISLSLYSGPIRGRHITSRTALAGSNSSRSNSLGWLLTGDAKLGGQHRRESWLRFYERVRSEVGTLMLPHHGAASNFHTDMLQAAPGEALLFVNADADDPIRPNEDVRDALGSRRWVVVTEHETDSLYQLTGPTCLRGLPSAVELFFTDWT